MRIRFSTTSLTFRIVSLFTFVDSSRCVVVSHCSFDMYLFDNQRCWLTFISELSFIFIPSFKMAILLFCCFPPCWIASSHWVIRGFYIFWIQGICLIYIANVFSQSVVYLCIFLNDVFWGGEVLNFGEVWFLTFSSMVKASCFLRNYCQLQMTKLFSWSLSSRYFIV